MLSYRIELAHQGAHQFRVTLTVPQPAAQQVLALPVWIPGSYLVREFAKHWSDLSATQGGQPVALRALDKASWQADCLAGVPLQVSATVYAFDPSVRTAWLDADRAFFNPSSLCLRVLGQEEAVHRIEIGTLPEGWQVGTAMRQVQGGYEATGYDELVDHPFEIGPWRAVDFDATGVPHEIVLAGAWPNADLGRLAADVQRICAAQIAFWGVAPFDRYQFQLWTVDDGHGGLEHRASTALIAARRDLPTAIESATSPSDGYVRLLGLFSHEYFHAWNVKRLRPAEFARFDYQRENTTELLWFFEGFTSYYDDLMLLRAGLIDAPRYLKLLAATVNGVLAAPGRLTQSLAEASYEAWIKYYRPDENSPNATVSYYAKGALVALCLDLALREQGRDLDGLMRQLWAETSGGPVSEAQILAAAGACAARLHDWVHSTAELPLRELLAGHGIEWRDEGRAMLAQRLGLKVREASGVQVTHVLAGSAAQQAGLSARDEILGVNGYRVRRLDEALQWIAPTGTLQVLVCRDQRLITLPVALPEAGPASVALALAGGCEDAALQRRQAWLKA